ncbi:alanine--tRNA ligase [Candidatus Kuenenbacteria bacterium CG_4_8_14_3_um_filter_39_15]|uniref:Alanine--tRNA ligase n=3 Tax=Candidatus Kueneniibacteriota TaxID=1752740 RepID=A0A2M7IMN5_9BACT|nr:alanine--tRNA ligase [Candidatus Kuenenbacteria bacterium]PIP28862.1 MAG: alanine--tRNA ligase [Candidatus Kuenenbacteria bacterium CG23_combo_of_CG06-09_8_20_14_all_39_39]PIW96073.1 MAG: alanine--tRNA ligase [Candidatus Kuenenbacteria bacterium CG_4_8_14_3_um_filter_39_15]
MTSEQLRKKYLEFFAEKGHAVIPSASLVPENDPSVLFTTAGMHPLVPFLMGEKHPAGQRLVNFQKCVRTGDIDCVGDQWHLTFFEMLGNWSLGDYGKKEALEWSYEFLTSKKWLGIPVEKLAVTVFAGDPPSLKLRGASAPFDREAFNIWQGLGIPEAKIFKYGKKENWWGPAGAAGPCGPDSEMFYVTAKPACGPDCQPACSCGKYVEIWNDVFMEYNKTASGKFEPLAQKNVDTGMGVERTVSVLNGYQDNYQELIKPLVDKIEELAGKKYEGEFVRSMRIIADHLRAATFIMGDDLGIAPSNVDQGYVVRKLIRRAIRHGRMIGIQDNFTHKIGQAVMSAMGDVYPELIKNKEFVLANFKTEEDKFTKTLQAGLKEFHKSTENTKVQSLTPSPSPVLRERGTGRGRKTQKHTTELSGLATFNLFQTYGFPLELTKEMAYEKGFSVDEPGFNQEFKKHQELSRTAAAGKFKGGLGEQTEQTIKYHTATHLLHAALRQVLGDHVFQRGSNITDERLRFDFSHGAKMSAEQKAAVEKIVNQLIDDDLPVNFVELPVAEAKKKGAIGVFADKYGEQVKVYSIGDYSREICGGPHVARTGVLGHFKIIKEEASSAGVRRIKAILQ